MIYTSVLNISISTYRHDGFRPTNIRAMCFSRQPHTECSIVWCDCGSAVSLPSQFTMYTLHLVCQCHGYDSSPFITGRSLFWHRRVPSMIRFHICSACHSPLACRTLVVGPSLFLVRFYLPTLNLVIALIPLLAIGLITVATFFAFSLFRGINFFFTAAWLAAALCNERP